MSKETVSNQVNPEQGNTEQVVEKYVPYKQEEGLWAKKVTVKLPWIKGQPEAVNVGVNGRFFLIKRGEEVEIPLPVFEALQNSEKMEKIAYEFEQKMQEAGKF